MPNFSRYRTPLAIIASTLIWGCSLAGNDASPNTLQRFKKSLVEEELSRSGAEARIIPASSEAQYEFLLGELALKNEDFDEALDHYKAAAESDTSAAPTLRRRLAQLYLRAGELDKALEEIDKVKELAETDPELLELKAGILSALKRTPEAIETYKKIVQLTDPGNEEPYVYIASLYAQESRFAEAQEALSDLLAKKPTSFFGNYYLAKILLAAGNFSESEKFYLKTLEISPNAESVKLELARVYAFQKRIDDAIGLCEEIVERNPANLKARGLLGELLLGKDRLEDALKEFEAMESQQTDPSETRFKIALIKLQRRDLEGAEVELRLVLAEHPENTAARYYLASAFAGMDRSEEAIEQLRQIDRGDKFFTESKTLAAFLYRQNEKYSEALEMVDLLLEDAPKDKKLLTLKTSLQQDDGDLKGAANTVKELIELEPTSDRHQFRLAVLYDELKQTDKAIAAIIKSIELNPNNANALNYLGYTYAEQGVKLEEAESLIKRALKLEPSNGYYIDSLGWVYYKMQRYPEAEEALQQANSIVSDDAVIMEHLAIVLLKVDKIDEAKKVIQKALEYAPDSDDKEVEGRLKKLLAETSAKSDD